MQYSRNRRQGAAARQSSLLLIVGWISAVISLFAYPFIFGAVGVITGVLASKNQSKGGIPLIITSIMLMTLGLLFSGIILNYTRHFLNI